MKKIFLSILMLSLMYNCDNNSVPSAEDIATFNKNVEAWKDVVSGFSSEDPEKVMSIFADSLKWNNPEALMNVNKLLINGVMIFYLKNYSTTINQFFMP